MIIPQLLLLLEMLVPVWIHVPEISRQTPASRFHPAAQHLPAANRHQLFAAGRLRVRSRRFNCSPFVWSAPKTRDTYGPPLLVVPLGECVRVKPWTRSMMSTSSTACDRRRSRGSPLERFGSTCASCFAAREAGDKAGDRGLIERPQGPICRSHPEAG